MLGLFILFLLHPAEAAIAAIPAADVLINSRLFISKAVSPGKRILKKLYYSKIVSYFLSFQEIVKFILLIHYRGLTLK
jgi:hypothetical protein